MILNEEELYKKSLEMIEKHINTINNDSPELEAFLKACDFVEQYEEKYYPLPNANLWDKIRFWFQYDRVRLARKLRFWKKLDVS